MTTTLDEIVSVTDFGFTDVGDLFVEVDAVIGNHPHDPRDYREDRVTAWQLIPGECLAPGTPLATVADVRKLVRADDRWEAEEPMTLDELRAGDDD